MVNDNKGCCPHCKAAISDNSALFCRECGQKLDMPSVAGNNQFEQPAKQKIKKQKPITLIVLCSILALSNVLLIALYIGKQTQLKAQLLTVQDLKAQVFSLQNENSSINSQIDSLQYENDNLQSQLGEVQDKADFLDEKIAIFVDDYDGYYYHRYGCSLISGKDFWALNTEAAEGKGKHPCPYCCD